MDPVTLVVTAVALGAATGLTEATTAAIKDAYAGLKGLLTHRRIDVSGIERKPDSTAQQAALQENLAGTPGAVDDEVLAAAQVLTEAIAAHDPQAARIVGVNLRDLQAEFVKLGSVTSSGDGVIAEGVRLSGGFTVDEVRAGVQEGDRPPPR